MKSIFELATFGCLLFPWHRFTTRKCFPSIATIFLLKSMGEEWEEGSFCRRSLVFEGTFDHAFELPRSTFPLALSSTPPPPFLRFVRSQTSGLPPASTLWNAPEFRGGCERRDKFYLTPLFDASEHCLWTYRALLVSHFFSFFFFCSSFSKISLYIKQKWHLFSTLFYHFPSFFLFFYLIWKYEKKENIYYK